MNGKNEQTSTVYGPDTYKSMRWRNGQGHTVELLKQGLPGNDKFAWRLSMADVTADGAFSSFAGYDRTLVLLSGVGLTLDFANGQQSDLTKPLQSVQFAGDERIFAKLHDGPIRDFNIMTNRDHCSAQVVVCNDHEAREIDVAGDVFFVFVVGNILKIQSQSAEDITVAKQHSICLRNPSRQTMNCSGAQFIAVQFTFH